MGTINRHYFFQLCLATFSSTTILLGILLYGNVVKHDEYLLKAMAVSPYSFIKLFSLWVPFALSFALPFGFILALLLCYGKWASSNQILALRSLGSGITSWGIPILFLSLIVSIFSVFIILDWGPRSRALFDHQKSTILWANINSLLEKEKEIELKLVKDNTILTNRNLEALSEKSISKVSLSVGSTDKNNWYNLRILLFDENNNLVKIINSKSANVTISDDKTKLLLNLKNVDLQSSDNDQDQNIFIFFEQWDEPLVFEINNRNDNINIKRVVLLGQNDIGKTELLNAIYWCIWGKALTKLKSFPDWKREIKSGNKVTGIFNNSAFDDLKEGEILHVCVTLTFELDKSEYSIDIDEKKDLAKTFSFLKKNNSLNKK